MLGQMDYQSNQSCQFFKSNRLGLDLYPEQVPASCTGRYKARASSCRAGIMTLHLTAVKLMGLWSSPLLLQLTSLALMVDTSVIPATWMMPLESSRRSRQPREGLSKSRIISLQIQLREREQVPQTGEELCQLGWFSFSRDTYLWLGQVFLSGNFVSMGIFQLGSSGLAVVMALPIFIAWCFIAYCSIVRMLYLDFLDQHYRILDVSTQNSREPDLGVTLSPSWALWSHNYCFFLRLETRLE